MEKNNAPNKALKKRSLIILIIAAIILAITVFIPPVGPDGWKKEQIVLSKAPMFDKYLDGKTYDYRILLYATSNDTALEISGSDLDLADRLAIKTEIKKGDTITVQSIYKNIRQMEARGKKYMQPEKVMAAEKKMDDLITWISILAVVLSLFVFFKPIKNRGWWCLLVFIVIAICLVLVSDVSVANTGNYTGFS